MSNPYEPPPEKRSSLKWWLLLAVAVFLVWLAIDLGSWAV
jgi:hypothetical protein